MKKSNSRWVCLALAFLALTGGFGCSTPKAFKSGVPYICDDKKSFVMDIYEAADIAFLTTPGKRFYLHRVPSADGVKYSDGNTTLWIKGNAVSVEIDGRTEFKNCFIKPK